jgi:hypothetical protein
VLDGQHTTRLLTITGGTLYLDGLILRNGFCGVGCVSNIEMERGSNGEGSGGAILYQTDERNPRTNGTAALLSLTNCSLLDNAGARGGAITFFNGGNRLSGCRLELTQCILRNNSALLLHPQLVQDGGSAAYSQAGIGGGVLAFLPTHVSLLHCTLDGNLALHSGGMFIDGFELSISRSHIVSNRAFGSARLTGDAGGLYVRLPHMHLSETIFEANVAQRSAHSLVYERSQVSGSLTTASVVNCNFQGHPEDGASIVEYDMGIAWICPHGRYMLLVSVHPRPS